MMLFHSNTLRTSAW